MPPEGFSKNKLISIHALLTESDTGWMRFSHRQPNFNPRSPHGERLGFPNAALRSEGFQSTLSSRRATWDTQDVWTANGISIHALLTESDCWVRRHHQGQAISIHALLTESDGWLAARSTSLMVFQSTLSSRRATGIVYPDSAGPSLFQSTLSSRRATHSMIVSGHRYADFNPRSPHGERLG